MFMKLCRKFLHGQMWESFPREGSLCIFRSIRSTAANYRHDQHTKKNGPATVCKTTESRFRTLASKAYASHPDRDHRSRNSVVSSIRLADKREQRDQVGIPSRDEQESQHFEIDLDGQLPEEAKDAPSSATFPSPRCANREEWQGACRSWSGKTHSRYLVFNRLRGREGVGANLMRIAWALNRAISFDLEPVFVGPLVATHGTGDFGDWIGLTHNPLLGIQDQRAFERATKESVPFPEGNGDAWFREQENRTSVAYQTKGDSVLKIKDWGMPVSTPISDTRVCPYVRQALRNIYWSVPQNRGRCQTFLPDGFHASPDAVVSGATGYQPERKRPWVLAVHVRRGDMIHFHGGARVIPHRFFSAAVYSVLRGIAAIEPAAHVSVLVFSEGPKRLSGLQLPDEHGKTITWDIEHESCLEIGLNCSQGTFLQASIFETFDCLAAADVVVGSESSFSEAAAAVSTNVKVMVWENQTEQDRVTLNSTAAASSGAVSSDEQLEMDTAIADWWYCSREVQWLTGSNAEILAGRQFYQTVDQGLPYR